MTLYSNVYDLWIRNTVQFECHKSRKLADHVHRHCSELGDSNDVLRNGLSFCRYDKKYYYPDLADNNDTV